MRLGLIARADNSGLGMQTLEFYRHMQPAKTLIVDISRYNKNKIYPQRYLDNPNGEVVLTDDMPQPPEIDRFLEGLDVVFIAEAAYNPYLYIAARERGVKTAVQYNYEFFDWFGGNTPVPDMFIAPSKWHYKDVNIWCAQHGIKHVYLHCPVDRQALPQREIKQARTFIHPAGKSAAHDRNGTLTVIEASKLLKTQARIAIRFQGEQGLPHQATHDIEYYRNYAEANGGYQLEISEIDYENYADAYSIGDVLVLPRRYGGNCLPLNEALSVGMPVIMTNISPNAGFLPENWLVPAQKIDSFTPRTEVDIYGAEPQALAEKIDHFYNMNESQMWFENVRAGNLARSISWPTMKPQYTEALESLCTR